MNAQNLQENFSYDLVVIGSGPAGIHAAVQAPKLKKTVCIIEKSPKKVGGALVHTGTIPSKAMREALDAVQGIRKHISREWVDRIMTELPLKDLIARAREVSSLEEELLLNHLKSNNIRLIEGTGFIESRDAVRVNRDNSPSLLIKAQVILIATGSKPRRPREIPFDGWRVVDSDELLQLKSLPRSTLIYGAGIIGCEYACILRSMGSQVTVIDKQPEIMRQMDSDVSNELKRIMEESGITFLLGEELNRIETNGPEVYAHLNSRRCKAELLFFAGGRVSCSDKLGIEKLGIETCARGTIKVNEFFQTAVPGIYAAGDVIGSPALAATGSHQGRTVACHAFGAEVEPFPKLFPVGVYTIPELSGIGKTESQLIEAKTPYVVGRAHYKEIARGHIRGETHGLIKMLVSKETHMILGIHIVGADAANLIHIGQAFMVKGGCAQDFVNMIFNYPTLAEGFKIAAFNALNKLFPGGTIGRAPGQTPDQESHQTNSDQKPRNVA